MKQPFAISIACIAAACCVDAKTVAWYHFDEALAGTRTAGESVIVNSVDGEVGVGQVRTWRKNGYNAPFIETVENLMPVYAKAFENYVSVFDPLLNSYVDKGCALETKSENSSSANSTASFLSISDHEKFHNQSFTLEFMLKLPEGYHPTWRFIVDKPFARADKFTDSKSMFQLVLAGNKDTQVTYLQAYIASNSGSDSVFSQNGANVCDGQWHHIAVVVDGEEKKMKLYVDKNAGTTATYSGELYYDDCMPMTFGAGPERYYGSFAGCIDEIRISDEALTPDKFLSFGIRGGQTTALVDENTLFYTSFSGSSELQQTESKYCGKNLSFIPAFLNSAKPRQDFPVGSLERANRDGYSMYSYATVPEVRYEKLVRDSYSSLSVENVSSYWTGVAPNEGKPTALLLKDDYKIVSDSFTIEFFGRMAEGEPSSGVNQYAYLIAQNEIFCFWSDKDGKLSLAVNETQEKMLFDGKEKSQKSYNDGKWHHYAIVCDKPKATLELYVDYERVGILENTQIDVINGINKQHSSDMVFFGYYYNYVYGPRDYNIDEIRITRGALSPERFIRKAWAGAVIFIK